MSERKTSSKTKSMNTKISDGSMPAGRDAVGVSSNCKLSKSSTPEGKGKLSEEEATFDSGILSAELSQTYSAEVDSLYTLSSECGSRSQQLRTQSPSSSAAGRKWTTSELLDSESEEKMGLSGLNITDSGVYTDVSERLSECFLKESCVENDAKSKQPNKSTTVESTTAAAQTKGHSSSSRDDLLREIFTQDEDGDT